ncbi:S8 family peptidase [Alkalihalobacterium elongatum]|uniref:S8 family peptidase n=1 Tax=Alkalihalobacterium elongatum TaxID=2675466 RepID=UPI001C1F3549|nr:S8 family peptidase [Alkalihalobacterium elongatum]
MATTKQLIVCFKPGTRRSSCLSIHKEIKAELVNEIKEIGIHVVTVPENQLSSCLSKYNSSQVVQFVEEDHLIQVEPITSTTEFSSLEEGGSSISTNDPLLEKQWGLANVNAQGAWDLARISPISAKIAILDTGVNRNHQDLRGKIIHYANFSSSPTVDDVHGHGTHVAGIAAARTNNKNGIAGMSYNSAGIMNIKVMGDTGGGTLSNVAQGIIYATNQGAHVINLSLGGTVSNETLRSAVDYAYNNGVLLVGAAGNNSSNIEHYPAAYNQVLAVAATNQSNELAPFSNYGSWVEVAAPGQDILSTFPGDSGDLMTGYRVASGTSQAAPFISGLAGLIKATNPMLTNKQIRSIIQRAATQSVSGETIQFGRIDARRAIQLARNTASSQLRRPNTPPLWLNTSLVGPLYRS